MNENIFFQNSEEQDKQFELKNNFIMGMNNLDNHPNNNQTKINNLTEGDSNTNFLPININNIPINMQINATNLNFPLNFIANQTIGNNINQVEFPNNLLPNISSLQVISKNIIILQHDKIFNIIVVVKSSYLL